jgi:uridine kinase
MSEVAQRILRLSADRVQRVAIDGVDGAGKTMFADELAQTLAPSRRPIIRASVDSFHNPKAIRYRRGRESPEGFYLDSYNYSALKQMLLDPLSPGGCGKYRTAIFDCVSDSHVAAQQQQATMNSILIFDGIFLHREKLRFYWDFSLFLDVAFSISIPRGASRGQGSADPADEKNRRYVEGQKLYLQTAPQKHANLIIDNDDLSSPRIRAGGVP